METPAIPMTEFDRLIDDYVDISIEVFNHQPSGMRSARGDLALFSAFAHERNITSITGETLLQFLVYARQERGNCSGTINRKLSSLRTYITFLRLHQVTGAHEMPLESLPRAREPYTGPITALSPDEVQRILATLDKESVLGFRDYLLFSLLYRLGLRLGEALAIDLDDIDFDHEVITIHGKGRRERTLPLVSDIPFLLKRWLLLRKRLYRANRQQALFLSKKGNRLAMRTAQEHFKHAVTTVGPLSLVSATPHSLRHAFASHALEGDADLFVLKSVLGHAKLTSTEIYLHPSMKLLRGAVNDHIANEILEHLIKDDLIVLRVHQKRVASAVA